MSKPYHCFVAVTYIYDHVLSYDNTVYIYIYDRILN